jgi:hypothetical protein
MHPHPKSDVQPLVPPIPIPPMLGSGHHFFVLRVKEGVPARDYVGLVLRLSRGRRGCGEGGRRAVRNEESGKRAARKGEEQKKKKKQNLPEELYDA